MAEQFEEKKDNISEEEIKDTASTNEDNNGTVNQDEQTEEAVETVENKDTAEASDTSFSLFPFLPCAILVFCLVFSLAITQFGKKERQ